MLIHSGQPVGCTPAPRHEREPSVCVVMGAKFPTDHAHALHHAGVLSPQLRAQRPDKEPLTDRQRRFYGQIAVCGLGLKVLDPVDNNFTRYLNQGNGQAEGPKTIDGSTLGPVTLETHGDEVTLAIPAAPAPKPADLTHSSQSPI